MAGNIKGITIEFDGDTTKLDKAIRGLDKDTAKVDAELKKVNNALKFNPTSIDLWRQKQTLLTQKIEDTQAKLESLKQKQKAMDAAGVDKNSEEYRKLQREIISTESKLKTFKGQLQSVGNIKLRVASEQLKQIGSKATAAGNAMRGISRAAAAVAVGIGALTKKSAKWADDVITASKVYGTSTNELQKYYAAANLVDVKAEDIVATHRKLERNMLNASLGSKKQALAFKELGIEYQNADGSLRSGDKVWQDTIEALSKMTNETERDAYAMALMGRSATNLNPLIEDGAEGYKLLSDAMEKYDLDFVDEDTLKRANDFNDQMDIMKSVTMIALQNIGSELAGVFLPTLEKVVNVAGKFANWISTINPELLAVVGVISTIVAAIAPLLLMFGALSTAAGAVAGALATVSAPMLAIGAAIAALAAAFVAAYTQSAPFREAINSLLGTLASAFMPVIKQIVALFKTLYSEIVETASGIATSLAPMLQLLMPVIKLVAKLLAGRLKVALTVITGVIKLLGAVIRGLAKMFSDAFVVIVNAGVNAVAKLRSVFSKVKNALTNPFEAAKKAIKGIIDKIKGFFGFTVKAPHIPLPHFAITPKGWKIGDLLKGIKPALSVKWYAKGGIFDSPTLAGIGENGPEAVVPLDKFWRKLEEMQGGDIVVNVYGSDNMSVNELAYAVEQRIIEMQKRRRMAWQ